MDSYNIIMIRVERTVKPGDTKKAVNPPPVESGLDKVTLLHNYNRI